MLPENVTLEMLEEAFKNHKRETCKVDCCIICFSETRESLEACVSGLNDSLAKGTDPLKGSEGSNPSASAIMKYANDYEAGY